MTTLPLLPTTRDLKYLKAALQAEKKADRKRNWTIAPPGTWSRIQTDHFIKWVTGRYSFKVDLEVDILKVPKVEGQKILEELNGQIFKTRPEFTKEEQEKLPPVPAEDERAHRRRRKSLLARARRSSTTQLSSGATQLSGATHVQHHSHPSKMGSMETIQEEDQDVSEFPLQKEKDWKEFFGIFPIAEFLSRGACKRVFKVYNNQSKAEEAISVMDVDAFDDTNAITEELVVTAKLSTLSKDGICPNFLIMHEAFTLPYDVPESHWTETKRPKDFNLSDKKHWQDLPSEPATEEACPYRYQLIRMELCNKGDLEAFLKQQGDECLSLEVAQTSLFQIAFALYAAQMLHSVKHYDVKLLNVFVQDVVLDSGTSNAVLRYGLESDTFFALHLPQEHAFYAKLADYGTANIDKDSTGRPVTMANFTTLENTPPDYLILGNKATQGHGHDHFGLGLSMLHLFTGHAPYEEILKDVECPPNLKEVLQTFWRGKQYSVMWSVIQDNDQILGEPDETLYHTLYRFLVLFGIDEQKRSDAIKKSDLWKAINKALTTTTRSNKWRSSKVFVGQYEKDCQIYSVRCGTNSYIKRARERLEKMDGGLDLLFRLCSFNPDKRATSLDVLKSSFMSDLKEKQNITYGEESTVLSFPAFSTRNNESG